jgi:putative transposase
VRREEGDPEGSHDGYRPPRNLKTSLGPVALRRPKLRGTKAPPLDRLFGTAVARTNALEAVVISGWVRGLSERDVEARPVPRARNA